MTTVKQLWRTKYSEHSKEVAKRLQFKAGMPEKLYPIEIRRALELRYRQGRYKHLGRQWREHMRVLHQTQWMRIMDQSYRWSLQIDDEAP